MILAFVQNKWTWNWIYSTLSNSRFFYAILDSKPDHLPTCMIKVKKSGIFFKLVWKSQRKWFAENCGNPAFAGNLQTCAPFINKLSQQGLERE